MIHQLAYHLILGKPLIMYGGLSTLALLLFTALVGVLNFHGFRLIPFKWHPRLAVLTIVVALLHGILGLSVFFNF